MTGSTIGAVMNKTLASMAGEVSSDAAATERAPEQPAWVRSLLESRLQRARHRIPIRFRWARFGDLLRKRTTATDAELDLLSKDFRRDVLLRGPSQTGKTSLACAVLNGMIDAGEAALRDKRQPEVFKRATRVQFITAYELARDAMHTSFGSRPPLVAEAIEASVLVLDDLGTEGEIHAASAQAVPEVIHERHLRLRPTIVTTYLDPQQLCSAYGAGIYNRMRSGCVINLRREGA